MPVGETQVTGAFKIQYEEQYVAFLDILGFTELTANANAKSQERLEACIAIVHDAITSYKGTEVKMLFVSDSIILSVKPDLDALILLYLQFAIDHLIRKLNVQKVWRGPLLTSAFPQSLSWPRKDPCAHPRLHAH